MPNSKVKVILLVLCVVLIGSSIGLARDTVIFGIEASIETLDPVASNTDATISALANIFDGLMSRTPDGNLEPALATSVDRVGPLTWRVVIRKGVKFHNGNPLTADDVKFTLERAADPAISRWLEIGGAIESITILDDYTLVIKTKAPMPAFVQYFDTRLVVDKEYVEGNPYSYVNDHPVGTGAYKFVEWVSGDHLTLEANEDYWRGSPSIKHVVFKPIVEESTRLAALLTGGVDLISNAPLESLDIIEDTPGVSVIHGAGRRFIFMGLNCRPGSPTSDVRVRRALYMAVNEDEIVDKVMDGYAISVAQLADPAMTGYNESIKRLPYDPVRAKELLAEAGYPDGFKLAIDVPFDRYVMDEQIGLAISVYFAQIGMTVDLHTRPKSIHFTNVIDGVLDCYMLGWMVTSYDCFETFVPLLLTPDPEKGQGSFNGGAFSDLQLDQMYADADAAETLEEREQLLQEAMAYAMEEVPVIPLHIQMDIYGGVEELNFTPRGDMWFIAREMSYK